MTPGQILLFNNDTSTAQIMKACLEQAGYKVCCYSDGFGAVDKIQAERPVLVILDYDLPGISSLAIIRLFRAQETNGRIPVMLVGLNMREEEVLLGLEVGADLCLTESFHPQVFTSRARSLIRRA